MRNFLKLLILLFTIFLSEKIEAQTVITSQKTTGKWYPVMLGERWDYYNDGDTGGAQNDLVGNQTNPLLMVSKKDSAFVDQSEGSATNYQSSKIYHFRVRIGQLTNQGGTHAFLALDVDRDNVADLFVESDGVYDEVIFHKANVTVTDDGSTPAKTVWYNSPNNTDLERNLGEFYGTNNSDDQTNSGGFTYPVFLESGVTTDLDLDSDGETDGWQEFAFSETALIDFAFDALGLTITGDSSIALFFFTTQGNTTNPNGDIAGIQGSTNDVVETPWEELGIILTTSLKGVATGDLITPTVNNLLSYSSTFSLTGTWGGDFGGADSLSVTVNGVTYSDSTSPAIIFNGNNWSLPLTGFTSGIYQVIATVSSTRTNLSESSRPDETTNELEIRIPGFTLSTTTLTVSESGTTATFTVVLDSQPSSDVVFDVTSGDTSEATLSTAALTFTSSNWNTAQTVTVTGVDDSLIDGDIVSTTTVSVNDGSSDNAFDGLSDQTVSVTTEDDDSVSVIDNVSPVITSGQKYSYKENQLADFEIGTVVATDNVELKSLSLISVFGSDTFDYTSDKWFFLNSSSGVIILTSTGTDGASNDYETKPNSFTLTIEAEDTAGNVSRETVIIVVTDLDEIPLNPDTDGDGVLDGIEVTDGTDPLDACDYISAHITQVQKDTWLDVDCDEDGLTNGKEKELGTDPKNSDTDGDGVLDGTEVTDGTDPLDACDFILSHQTLNPSDEWNAADCDEDGLSNKEEKELGTDPKNSDTDGDGVIDGTEITDNTDVLDNCSLILEHQTEMANVLIWNQLDCDNDSLPNGGERREDTDNDGILNFLDSDDDNDGIPTIKEYPDNNKNAFDEDAMDVNNNNIPDYLEANNFNSNEMDGIEVYNVLTPNGDGVHDIFTIRNISMYPDNEVKVYNRWGKLVYEMKGYGTNGRYFNGTSNLGAQRLSSGTYFYVLNYRDANAKNKTIQGYLYLNR